MTRHPVLLGVGERLGVLVVPWTLAGIPGLVMVVAAHRRRRDDQADDDPAPEI